VSAAVLVDTSLWVEHFRAADERRSKRLESFAVLMHEFVLGELIIGYVGRSHPAISRLSVIPRVETIQHDEVVRFVREHKLEGCGIGWIDAHLIAAAAAAGAGIWTLDRTLSRTAALAGLHCV
jgi:predicted nucleic acid-binding protein